VFAQGIPEPDLVMFGLVLNVNSNADIPEGYGTLSWTFQPAGAGVPIHASSILTNIDSQFSYILHIHCETPLGTTPVSSNTITLSSAPITYYRTNVTWTTPSGTTLVSLVQPAQGATTFSSLDRGRVERVDLDASVPVFDTAGTGLPDDWQIYYFGHTGVDPFGLAPDGMTTLAAYLAGVNPNDLNGAFKIIHVEADPQGGVRVDWNSVANRVYVIQRASSISGSFADLQANIAATPPVNSFRDQTTAGHGALYYRVALQQGGTIVNPPFNITSLTLDRQGGLRIVWSSQNNQVYVLQRSTNVAHYYVDVSPVLSATPPSNSYRDTNVVGLGPYFYRLRLGP
jgi:hypothetical protein